ncbi:cofactor-independent phosphoglycerate mutase [Desulfobulbus alkaliphilus]|uniref:cofactor-independent phosphoglycerate mutase n=1 Tax=Desulfobulbus alkaliphilus TaxID=869814 RepID=UPI001962FED8|nr:cofactor-independent phosphoglycerate mutase [Desulfobulbus alkaliphilus]MBM9537828.1 cofactor-independent phosphoglycerate mutase [Desulfobulbus alkaliphilus]
MKYILLIGDGMGDVAVPELGGKTPLEAAATPAMDRLARQSEMLLVRTVPAGYPPGSDIANLSLLGYQPETCYTGRAPLEAASMGVDIGAEEIAFRCNLVHVERHSSGVMIMKDYSAGHISTAESRALLTTLQAECGSAQLTLYPGISYRHLLVYRGSLPEGWRTVPPHDHSDGDVAAFYQTYLQVEAFRDLYTRVAAILDQHPVNLRRAEQGKITANFIWLWGEGKRPVMETLESRYGIRGGLISAVDLLKGLGVLSGLRVVEVEGATGYLDTNYEGKARAALEVLERDDFVLVHVEAPDEAGHQGLAREKVRAIEDFDQRIVAPIVAEMERRGEPFRLVVTMDHYTPVHRKTHEDWPVPMFLYDSRGCAQPSGLEYTEAHVLAAVERTGLVLPSGPAFFRRFISQEKDEK